MKTTDFTDNPEVRKILSDLRHHFGNGEDGKREFIISDIVDSEGHQYVNLVQEGGGVLGIALVGYTYVLEQMGIRFINLAGTSAGAINTILISVIGKKQDEKSLAILAHLADLKLFDFVDGPPVWKFLIGRITSRAGYFKILKRIIVGSVSLAVILALASSIVYFAFPRMDPVVFRALMTGTFAFIGVVILMVVFVKWMFGKFHKTGWGINPGIKFRQWISDILEANDASTVGQWQARISQMPETIHIRPSRHEDISDLKPEVCLITSDITTQVKVEFPRMACLYWKDFKAVNPAEFVRASMSIPVFFQAAKVKNIPADDPDVKQCWKEMLSYEKRIPKSVMMVDGGLLSNFPINIFFNPSIDVARLPTLGIRLQDEDTLPKENFPDFSGYLSAIFNTVRYYYDRDFLIKNSIFEKSIGRINVRDFNWLNFNLSDKEKLQLFINGAKAASDFLKGFDWHAFKNYRRERKEQIQKVK